MTRIDDRFLECIFYIYPSVYSAYEGESIGGCGFIVGITSEEDEEKIFFYAVTNSHVVRNAATPVLRLNTEAGEIDCIETNLSKWHMHKDGDDIAVFPLDIDIDKYKFKLVPIESFISEKVISDHKIGPGDLTFMVGRLITQDGKQRNLPSVRFGNISMMPYEPVRMPTGINQDAFLVETRSIGGYSGSPVFVEIPPLSDRPGSDVLEARSYGWLIGIDCGHLPLFDPVLNKQGEELSEGWKVRSNTGIMVVIPAWKLRDVLYSNELVLQRKSAV